MLTVDIGQRQKSTTAEGCGSSGNANLDATDIEGVQELPRAYATTAVAALAAHETGECTGIAAQTTGDHQNGLLRYLERAFGLLTRGAGVVVVGRDVKRGVQYDRDGQVIVLDQSLIAHIGEGTHLESAAEGLEGREGLEVTAQTGRSRLACKRRNRFSRGRGQHYAGNRNEGESSCRKNHFFHGCYILSVLFGSWSLVFESLANKGGLRGALLKVSPLSSRFPFDLPVTLDICCSIHLSFNTSFVRYMPGQAENLRVLSGGRPKYV